MPTYDLDIDHAPRKSSKRGGPGCSIFIWTIFVIVLIGVVYVGDRMYFYYQKIRHGEIIDLPQYDNSFTRVAGSAPVGPLDVAASDVDSVNAAFAYTGPAAPAPKLTIVEFADFECPYSKDEAPVVRTLMAKYGDRVRFEFRDFPLDSIHPDASNAALAARCAKEQGKFWAYHDKLFVSSPALTFKELSDYANQVGLDPKQFDRCLADQRYKNDVDADRATAQRLGVTGTPTFFFNGKRVEGAIPSDAFENLIQKLLQ